MSLISLGINAAKSITRKAADRIKTFGKHAKSEGLTREVKEQQEFLKNSDTSFRKYNRSTKMYEPRVPRGKKKKSPQYQDFLKELNSQNETMSTYKDIKQTQKEYEQITGEPISFQQASTVSDIEKGVSTENEAKEGTDSESLRAAHTYNAMKYNTNEEENKVRISRREHIALNNYFWDKQSPREQLLKVFNLVKPVLSPGVRNELYTILELTDDEMFYIPNVLKCLKQKSKKKSEQDWTTTK